jgi:hypothetical protein
MQSTDWKFSAEPDLHVICAVVGNDWLTLFLRIIFEEEAELFVSRIALGRFVPNISR